MLPPPRRSISTPPPPTPVDPHASHRRPTPTGASSNRSPPRPTAAQRHRSCPSGRGEALPGCAAACGVQPRRRPHLPCLEASRVVFEVSGVICSGTNLDVSRIWFLINEPSSIQHAGRAGFPAHPSIPFNPGPVYCCASATLQAATVDAAASSRAHCRTRASQVHLLAAVSAIAETNQELVASKHQAQAPLLHQVKCQPENRDRKSVV